MASVGLGDLELKELALGGALDECTLELEGGAGCDLRDGFESLDVLSDDSLYTIIIPLLFTCRPLRLEPSLISTNMNSLPLARAVLTQPAT